ncbi:uncharacterized protein LOC100278611 [Zea mays]|uniref:TFIIS N-terminal domain-containing protein n=1 Tax=Zea mays TaxID=4577 RepID=B6UBB9_MAIZE|nr:uncharacterized protein LOC100278611 [Zea mays]ACG46652.1 hypothetical protein [Zea mays]|eukprot:NP_001145305.1 uncharacterized protein LOC100278611 [Zea mays]
MADEQSGLPLRRWRPFFGAFEAIDGVIEACGYPRSEFRDVRGEIVVLLRGATDDGVAEQLCAALDDVMVESLKTLLVAPVPYDLLASSDLARTVGALGSHGSFRIRSLARDVVRGWRVAVEASCTTAVAVKKKLDNLSADKIPLPRAAVDKVHEKKLHVPSAKTLPAAVEVHNKKPRVPSANMLPTATVTATAVEVHNKKPHVPPAKTLPSATILSNQQKNMSETKKSAVAESEKMEATKRKLREGYQEADGVKRRRSIQTIREEEGKLLEQKQCKMHVSHRMERGPIGYRTKTSSSVSGSRARPPPHVL